MPGLFAPVGLRTDVDRGRVDTCGTRWYTVPMSTLPPDSPPPAKDSHRSTRLLTARVPIPVAEAVDRCADRAGLTRNAYVCEVVSTIVKAEEALVNLVETGNVEGLKGPTGGNPGRAW